MRQKGSDKELKYINDTVVMDNIYTLITKYPSYTQKHSFTFVDSYDRLLTYNSTAATRYKTHLKEVNNALEIILCKEKKVSLPDNNFLNVSINTGTGNKNTYKYPIDIPSLEMGKYQLKLTGDLGTLSYNFTTYPISTKFSYGDIKYSLSIESNEIMISTDGYEYYTVTTTIPGHYERRYYPFGTGAGLNLCRDEQGYYEDVWVPTQTVTTTEKRNYSSARLDNKNINLTLAFIELYEWQQQPDIQNESIALELSTHQNQSNEIYLNTIVSAVGDLENALNNKVPNNRTINGFLIDGNPFLGATQFQSISYNAEQNLTDKQKKIARENCGVLPFDFNESKATLNNIKNKTHGQSINYCATLTKYNSRINFFVPDNFTSLVRNGSVKLYINNGEVEFGYPKNYRFKSSLSSSSNYYITTHYYGSMGGVEFNLEYYHDGSLAESPFDVHFTISLEINEFNSLEKEYLPIPEVNVNEECQTLEKFMGKPLYCKLLKFDSVPSKTSTSKVFSTENVFPVRVDAYVQKNNGDSYILPYNPSQSTTDMLFNGVKAIYANAETVMENGQKKHQVTIRSSMTESNACVYATVYYIKN